MARLKAAGGGIAAGFMRPCLVEQAARAEALPTRVARFKNTRRAVELPRASAEGEFMCMGRLHARRHCRHSWLDSKRRGGRVAAGSMRTRLVEQDARAEALPALVARDSKRAAAVRLVEQDAHAEAWPALVARLDRAVSGRAAAG